MSDPAMDGPATDDLEGTDRDVADEDHDREPPARVRTGDEGKEDD